MYGHVVVTIVYVLQSIVSNFVFYIQHDRVYCIQREILTPLFVLLSYKSDT